MALVSLDQSAAFLCASFCFFLLLFASCVAFELSLVVQFGCFSWFHYFSYFSLVRLLCSLLLTLLLKSGMHCPRQQGNKVSPAQLEKRSLFDMQSAYVERHALISFIQRFLVEMKFLL